MKRTTRGAISVLIVLCGILLADRGALALDAPHNVYNIGRKISCASCHYSSTTPAWVSWSTASADDTFLNNLCKSCHSATSGKVDTTGYVKTHSATQTKSPYWSGNWTVECRVCHYAHGQQQMTAYGTDGTISIATGTVSSLSTAPSISVSSITDNYSTFTPDQYVGYLLIPNTAYPTRMWRIKTNDEHTITVHGALSTGVGKTYSIRYGKMINATITYPGPAYINAPVKFFTDSGVNSYATETSTSTSLCMVCHTKTSSYNNTGALSSPVNHSDEANQLPGGNCKQCHGHGDGFKHPDAGCNDCHGNPPTWNTLGVGGLVGLGDKNTVYYPTGATSPLSIGAHVKHSATTTGNLGMNCRVCHSNHNMPRSFWDMRMGFQVDKNNWFSWGGTKSVTTGTIDVYSSLSGSYAWLEAPGTQLNRGASYAYTCSAVYCHGGGTSSTSPALVSLSGGSNTTPSWVGANQAVCGSCHGTTASTYNTAGSHGRHAGNGAGQLNLACSNCHGTISDSSHVNGSVKWNLNTGVLGAGAQYRGLQSGATGDLAPSTLYGTCSSVQCHSTGQAADGTATVSYTNQVWGDPVLNCGSCHKNMNSDPAAPGNHKKHALDRSILCATCHNGYTATTTAPAMHVNNSVNLSFSDQGPGNKGAWTSYSQGDTHALGNGFGTCTVSYCHSTGQAADGTATPVYATATWGGGSLNCGACHKDMNSDPAAPGSHVQHAQNARISCAVCHSGYSWTTATASTHVDGYVYVGFTGQGAGTTYSQASLTAAGNGYGNCSTSACHGAGTKIWGSNTNDAQCVKCHGVLGVSPALYAAEPRYAAPGWTTPGWLTIGRNTAGTRGTVVNNVSNDSKVGAHLKHLSAYSVWGTIGYSSDVACSNCHTLWGSVGGGSHMNGSTSWSWSDFVQNKGTAWGTAASGVLSPTYASGTCSNMYCHGSAFWFTNRGTGITVGWTSNSYITTVPYANDSAGCNRCHMSPPRVKHNDSSQSHAPSALGTCNGCHGHNGHGVMHINGILEATGNCDSCHWYDISAAGAWSTVFVGADATLWNSSNAWGGHIKHIRYLKAKNNIAALDPATDQWGTVGNAASASYAKVCGVCHGKDNMADHQPDAGAGASARNIWAATSDRLIRQHGPSVVTWHTVSRSCANLNCHYQAAPVW